MGKGRSMRGKVGEEDRKEVEERGWKSREGVRINSM